MRTLIAVGKINMGENFVFNALGFRTLNIINSSWREELTANGYGYLLTHRLINNLGERAPYFSWDNILITIWKGSHGVH